MRGVYPGFSHIRHVKLKLSNYHIIKIIELSYPSLAFFSPDHHERTLPAGISGLVYPETCLSANSR